MKGQLWRGFGVVLAMSVAYAPASGQKLRLGSTGASGGIAVGEKFGMRSLIGQATSGIPVNKNYRHGVGFWFADTEIKIPNATEEVDFSDDTVPATFQLRPNYPNPFNPSTTIEYAVPVGSHVLIEVFNMLGQRVSLLVNELKVAGTHRVSWNAMDESGRPASSGLYVYRMVADQYVETRTMTLVK